MDFMADLAEVMMNEQLNIVLLIFKNTKNKFIDVRMVKTELTREEVEIIINEYMNFNVPEDICKKCKLSLIQDKCYRCKHHSFDINEFMTYMEGNTQTEELSNTGIFVYNNLIVHQKESK